jgi:hypothetical protein
VVGGVATGGTERVPHPEGGPAVGKHLIADRGATAGGQVPIGVLGGVTGGLLGGVTGGVDGGVAGGLVGGVTGGVLDGVSEGDGESDTTGGEGGDSSDAS